MEKERKTVPIEHPEKNGHAQMRDVPFGNMHLDHIQKLAHLLDQSDITEIELRRAEEGLHLLLRKLKAPGRSKQRREVQYLDPVERSMPIDPVEHPATTPKSSCLKAEMVGTFHPWLKPHGKALVAVGDFVKVGQVVGTIEALFLFNEVKTTVAGRVLEICVHDNQPVEYGQTLITIDSSGAEEL